MLCQRCETGSGFTMKTGDLRFWRSSMVCWALFSLFTVLTLIWQTVDDMPYPHKERDDLVGTIGFGGLAVGFFVLALRDKKSN